jgi:hypothetical protein
VFVCWWVRGGGGVEGARQKGSGVESARASASRLGRGNDMVWVGLERGSI